jgi:hypothetical protein
MLELKNLESEVLEMVKSKFREMRKNAESIYKEVER